MFCMTMAGIDGGGSKTTAAIATNSGEIIGISRTGPSRFQNVGEEEAERVIGQAVENALKNCGKNKDDIDHACFGLGGIDTEKYRSKARRIASEIIQNSHFSVVSDGVIGVYSGTFGDSGMCIISGTGAIVQGINAEEEIGRVDGWGRLFGDQGSAYFIGRRGLKAVFEQFDNRGNETILTDLILDHLDLERTPELLDHFASVKNETPKIAEVARIVDTAAEKGDEVAKGILKDASKELERSARTLIDKLGMDDLKPLKTVLIGGVFKSETLRKSLKNNLVNDFSEIKFIRPTWEPVVGALVLSLRKSGHKIDAEVIENLKTSIHKGK